MARVLNFPSPSLPMWVPSPAAPPAGPRIPNGYHINGCSTGRYSASPSGSSSSSGSSRRSSDDGSGGCGGISKNPLSLNPKNMLFPFNPSLEEELNRLFTNFLVSHTPAVPQNDDVWEEFRHNGRDYEYCPDPEDPIVPTHSKKRNKKPLPSECVFCKNNGEDVKIYKKHLLKDADGRILCPILRNYTCPICGVNGDEAHTIKYCPKNKQTHSSGSVHALKALRNSTGRRRSK